MSHGKNVTKRTVPGVTKERDNENRPLCHGHPELGNKFERDFWARGYCVSTIVKVDEETIRKYIREQEEESKKESRTLK